MLKFRQPACLEIATRCLVTTIDVRGECLFRRGRYQHRRHVLFRPNVTELKKAGIRVRVRHGKFSTNWISEVNFKRDTFTFYNGTLYLPQFSVYLETTILLRNLLAYIVEKTENLVSYIHLMDCLINTEEDVKLMRDSGVLKNNTLGSDKLLVDIWNKILTGIKVGLNEPYGEAFDKVTEHYENRWNHFFAALNGLHVQIGPWLFGGAALLLLNSVASVASSVISALTDYYGSKQRHS